MQRRNFLTGIAGILAAGVAPAVVHNPMKIVVPRKEIVPLGEWLTKGMSSDAFDAQRYLAAMEISERNRQRLRQRAWELYVESGYPAPKGFLAGGMA